MSGSSTPSFGFQPAFRGAQQQAVQRGFGIVNRALAQPFPIEQAPQIVPGINPLEQQFQQFAGGFGGQPLTQAREAALLRLTDPDQLNQLFTQAVQAPAQQQFQQQILPSVFERFAGQRGGSVLAAGGQAAQNFATNLSGQRAQLQLQAPLQAGALGLQSQLAQAGLQQQAGGQLRGIEQSQQQEAFQRFLLSQQIFNPALGFLPTVAGIQRDIRTQTTPTGGLGGLFG